MRYILLSNELQMMFAQLKLIISHVHTLFATFLHLFGIYRCGILLQCLLFTLHIFLF